MRLLNRTRMQLLIRGLRAEGQMPSHVEVTAIGNAFLATVYDEEITGLMSESVTTGLSACSDLAVLKALTEYVERRAFWEAGVNGDAACLTSRSDGVAAFPRVLNLSSRAALAARSNAFCEAVERYVWANWWDDRDVAFSMQVFAPSAESAAASLLKCAAQSIPIRSWQLIEPSWAAGESKIRVFILLGELEGGGYISGGAAGFGDEQGILFRAASELFRHAIAISRIRKNEATPLSFYEERLSYFGSGAGDKLVRNRLACQGNKTIGLPALKFDTAIPHSLSHLVALHRCYFENQPPFMGGELERLCV